MGGQVLVGPLSSVRTNVVVKVDNVVVSSSKVSAVAGPSPCSTTSSPLNPRAIVFIPPTRPKRSVEPPRLSFWAPALENPVAIVAPLSRKARKRLSALARQGSISLD